MKNEEEVEMKNNCMSKAAAVMAFLIICFCASGALAENRAGAINITPFIGGENFEKDLPFDNGWAYGIGLGYNISEKLGVEATVHYIETDYDGPVIAEQQDFNNTDASVWLFKLDGLYHFTKVFDQDVVVPYLAAGAGMQMYDADSDAIDGTYDKTRKDFILNYGGGLKVFLTRSVALRGDVRHIVDFRGSDYYNKILYTAGLTFELGGKEEVKEAPAPEPEPAPAPAPVVTPPPPPPAPAVKEQGSIIFRNIQFDLNKADIKAESYPILDEVVDYLKANPNVKMEVQGHTCNLGKAEYNMKLSDKRAASVKTYLVDKGVAADRLETKGYGLTKPVAPNDKEENRARNRRVEFKPIQ